MNETYETHAKGIRIVPGRWRPHYPWEQIAWISPSWPSQDYAWLDFPEAIVADQGFLYVSHVNPVVEAMYENLPEVKWRTVPDGLAFDRVLPSGVCFGGSVVQVGRSEVQMELHMENGSAQELTNINLRTCLYLRAAKEFCDFTNENKFVHLSEGGWVRLAELHSPGYGDRLPAHGEEMRIFCDLPLALCVANEAQRLVAMTWFEHTFQMGGNPARPCLHADPVMPDLQPGDSASIHGKLIFFAGSPDHFLEAWKGGDYELTSSA